MALTHRSDKTKKIGLMIEYLCIKVVTATRLLIWQIGAMGLMISRDIPRGYRPSISLVIIFQKLNLQLVLEITPSVKFRR